MPITLGYEYLEPEFHKLQGNVGNFIDEKNFLTCIQLAFKKEFRERIVLCVDEYVMLFKMW